MTRETELLATWLDNVEEADLREELEAMRDDEKAAIEAFHKDLEFGTAGLRGIIGAGTDRMNVYTVGRATQGFAEDEDVRTDALVVACQHLAGAGNAALHLVGHEEDVVLLADVIAFLQVAFVGDVHASLALDGL